LHEIEMQFAALGGQQKELAAALEDPAAYTPGGRAIAISRDLSSVADDLARLTPEWEASLHDERALTRVKGET
jgi:hypothetical protein